MFIWLEEQRLGFWRLAILNLSLYYLPVYALNQAYIKWFLYACKDFGYISRPMHPLPHCQKRCYVPILGILDIEQFKYYVYLCRVS